MRARAIGLRRIYGEGVMSRMDVERCAWVMEGCGKRRPLALGNAQELHAYLCSVGLDRHAFLRAKLVYVYAMSDATMVHARQMFDKIPNPNSIAWNAMIKGCVKNRLYREAFVIYHEMKARGASPDFHTFSTIVKACAEISAVRQGRKIHTHLIKRGFESGTFIVNSLIAMYSKGREFREARQVFDKMPQRDIVSWNTVIASCTQSGYYNEALELFYRMEAAGMNPDSVTVSSVLPACACLAYLTEGRRIHDYLIRNELQFDVFVGSSLIDMYAKCNDMDASRQVFDSMPHRDVVLWNAMIAGYAHNGYCDETLTLFREMQFLGLKPTHVTIASIMPACAQLALLKYGRAIHAYVLRSAFDSNVFIASGLVDMYAKCGTMEVARQVFDKMSHKDLVSWTAVIAGYGLHGRSEDVLALFRQMRDLGMKPDHVTFVAVLSACSHAGLLREGWECFEVMSHDPDITLGMEHYACMVDLLGRCGRLDEAYNFITKMPLEPNSIIWGALLGACRIHDNVELGEHVTECLFELDPGNEGYYVLLSNIYSTAGRWDGVAKVRIMMRDRGLKKKPGCSWIEVNNRVHAFVGGDTSHPESQEIYAMLESLSRQMKVMGYVPETNFVLDDVEDDKEKEKILARHSERLAIAFGIIKIQHNIPIRITKNLRVCGDCHNATKFISKIVGREIIVRDMNRFHCFKDGLCSCGDFW